MGGTGPAAEGLGVLEQEVLVEPFSEMCQAAGFAQVHVCPIAYVIPEFELSLEEWRAWRPLSPLKRPFSGGGKNGGAPLGFFGGGQKTALVGGEFPLRRGGALPTAGGGAPLLL